jgi:hypothetical protein
VIGCRDGAILVDEAVPDEVGIEEEAHNIAAVVDTVREGQRGSGDVDPGVITVLVSQVPADRTGIEVYPHDLTAVVDVVSVRRLSARYINRGVVILAAEKTTGSAVIEIEERSDDLASIVQTQGLGWRSRDLDGRVVAPVQIIAVALAACVFV